MTALRTDGLKGRLMWPVAAPVLILLLTLAVYWPVIHAGFVSDDVVDFQNLAWLRHGEHWQEFVFHKFNYWTNYFRPLVVAMFVVQLRVFDVAPGPMHAVSLVIHLINTLLVGMLAARVTGKTLREKAGLWALALSMLLYGMHPLLIEAVTWIGCQFDLMATFFMLLALIANQAMSRPLLRALTVGACFFLAACTKESAASLPFLIALFDWFGRERQDKKFIASVREILRSNGMAYVAMVAAGVAYIIFRHWALGTLMQRPVHPTLLAYLQESSYIYLRYWRLFFLPMNGMSPLHIMPAEGFQTLTLASLLTMLASATLIVGGVYLTLRRVALGYLLLAVTFGLLPVLHLVPVAFDDSLYHERYAMTALALACVLLPLVLSRLAITEHRQRLLMTTGYAVTALWLLFSAASIRITVPYWYSNINLWRWALVVDPSSVDARDNLIAAYVDAQAYHQAWQVFDGLGARQTACPNCMLNMALVSLDQGNLQRASELLDGIDHMKELPVDQQMPRSYLYARGKLRLLQKDYAGADAALKSAMALEPLDPDPQLALATSYALQGRLDEARTLEQSAIELLTPERRVQQRVAFDAMLRQLASEAPAS